jgi:hypothetical protein
VSIPHGYQQSLSSFPPRITSCESANDPEWPYSPECLRTGYRYTSHDVGRPVGVALDGMKELIHARLGHVL